MSLHRVQSFALALACLTLAGQAFAQNPPVQAAPAPSAPAQTPAAPNVPAAPDTDETFLTGLRRVGVMAGQVVECSADAEKQAKIGQAMELANKIAIHFGLKAAFNYVGAIGYGSGHPFRVAQPLATPRMISIRLLSGPAASSATQARGSSRATTHRPFAAASIRCNQLPGCCCETKMC
jgi:hypothetical protein